METILLATVGSELHGTNVSGNDDHDQMGVCLEPPEYVIGLDTFEQRVYRTALDRERAEHGRLITEAYRNGTKPPSMNDSPKSQPGDVDCVIYGLRKFCRLALGGNPNLMSMFFVPGHLIIKQTRLGQRLMALAPSFVSRETGKHFLGYLRAQKQRLLGERGQKDVNRPELVAKFGFDTKYAYHALRLGFQGIEILTTGRIIQPIAEPTRQYLCDVRLGGYTFDQVASRLGELERDLGDIVDTWPLPKEGDRATVNEFLIAAYTEHWAAIEVEP